MTERGRESGTGPSTTFGYDANGNMTSVAGSLYGSWTLVHDEENRLTSIAYGGVTDLYYYNWQGQRYRARLSEAYWRYEYNGDPVMEETNDTGGARRVRLPDEAGGGKLEDDWWLCGMVMRSLPSGRCGRVASGAWSPCSCLA